MSVVSKYILDVYRTIPSSFRSFVHLMIHRFNSNRLLLWFFQFRHFSTCKRLARLEKARIRIGESYSYPGWISTNYQVICYNFLDVTKPLVGVNNLNLIIADNVIEHLSLNQGKLMLTNLYNSMESGGTLRISTPNLRGLVDKYLGAEMKDLIQFKHDLGQHNVTVSLFPDLLRVPFTAFGHDKGYLYDFENLKSILEQIGFEGITQEKTSVSSNTILCNVENRNLPSDQWAQLCVEAVKN